MTRKKISRNLKEWKTTAIGLALWIMTGFYFFMPYFSDRQLWEPEHYEVGFGVISGLILLIAPDRLIDFLFTWRGGKK